MKATYIFQVILLIGVLTSGCDKLLDLAPEDTIIEDKVFEKFSTAESAVAGTYHMLFAASTTDYVMAEATSSNCAYSAAAGRTYDEINSGAILAESTLIQGIYEAYYAALVQANLLLNKIPLLGKYDDNLMKQHMAEAKFIRAYAYLRLLAWYGDGALLNRLQNNGVVLYLEHYDGFNRDADIRPRNSNDEVYNQIISDLEEAITDLPEPGDQSSTEKRVSRANRATCEALLARVSMYKRDYSAALTWLNKVLQRPEYQLENDILKVFPPNPDGTAIAFSKEHLFGFPVSTNGGNWQFGGNNIYYVYNQYWYSTDLIGSFADTDLRKSLLMRVVQYQGNPVYVTEKYSNPNGRDNLTLMRLPEMLLYKAEALARTSGSVSQEMIDLLNEVHLRANATASPYQMVDFSSSDLFIQRVLLEISKEFAFEGCSRFDQLRSDQPLYNRDLAENKKVLPIPLREVQISKGIVEQNEGYQ